MSEFVSKTANNAADTSDSRVLFAITDMLRYKASAKDARFPIREIFFDAGQGHLRFVALDVGGWFDNLEVVVSTQLMGEPDESNREWPVEISPDAIKAAPEWSDPRVLDRTVVAAMPQIMVGPFGGGFAGFTALNWQEAQDDPETPGNLKVDGFSRLSDWVGLPVFGQNGDVGTLIDILFEPKTKSLSHLVIDTGGAISAQQMVVPYDRLVHLAEGGGHVVMDVTEKLLREAPSLEHFDMLNRAWLDKLRAYYQLTECSLRVARRMSFTTCSAGAFVVTGFFIIFNSIWGQDEPQTLRYAIILNCSMGADGGHAATEFVHHTGSAWRPRTGSMVNRQNMTAALIDSRDFLAAKRRAETEVMLPAGPKVALTGGTDFNDHRLIWGKLDQVRTKYPDMVLLHGGSPKGAELIATKWAEARGVTQVAFKPDWTKHAKAAPFKRNDALLDVLPVGVLVFPGNGIQENLADKAKKLGIPVMKFERGA